MVDWWFGWHGEEPQRYKLWHPRAHLHACWTEPGTGYVGRTSVVDEYIGTSLRRASIRFVPASAPERLWCAPASGCTGSRSARSSMR
jgi:hypothetical protein